ncbi:MAG: T9SS type A sorting domain-containing protein, partial [Candidatus Kapabacteria bacterium]|nr:T9SS type A sorting domain-containing protein [Candidatus Kapabacteria bacterium]
SYSNCRIEGVYGDFDQGSQNIGGLVGKNRSRITYSYAMGEIHGDSFLGGLVGLNYAGGTVSKSYATSDVYGLYCVGGFVGLNYEVIDNSYARGIVSGKSEVGGFIGVNSCISEDSDYIEKSYSTGKVTGINVEKVGGFVGEYVGCPAFYNCLWDSVSSELGYSVEGTGRNTQQMKSVLPGFDFNTIWSIDPNINDGYPYLQIKTVSVRENPETEKTGISLYPNPANEFVKITIKDQSAIILNVRIVDLFGRLIKEGEVGGVSREIIIPVSEITSGYYLVRIQTNREYLSLALIVE